MKKKILALSLCVVLLLTGCGPLDKIAKTAKNVANNVSDTTSSPKPTATPAPKETAMALGKTGSVDDWKFKVSKASSAKKIKNGSYRVFEPDKGNYFVIINMSVKNIGKKKETFLPRVGYEDSMMTAKLLYKDKYEYQPSQLLSYDKDIVDDQINPLASKKGIVVFEVPKNVAKNLKSTKLRIGTKMNAVVYTLK